MYKRTINKVKTEANMELCINRLMNTKFIEITNIDKTPMPTWCTEITLILVKDMVKSVIL